MQKLILIIVILTIPFIIIAQCTTPSNVYTFNYGGVTYKVVKENKTWTEAAACALEKGGFLAEINDAAEQNAIYNELINNAGIIGDNTISTNGGGIPYVWIGGNDLTTEGNWIWDGDGNLSGTQFWSGLSNGFPVNSSYTNWAME